MAARMLIDAAHPEETRVAVVRGSRLEEFDFESATRRPLRGNVYLAKVTRVEPSLQSSFVDFGGDRHGFLPFNEIHPDYYQIPIEDRQALLEREAEQTVEDDEEADPGVPDEPAADGESPNAEDGEDGEDPAATRDTEPQPGLGGVESIGGDDEVGEAVRERRKKHHRAYKIQEVIKRRQILLVQAVKEVRGTKGAALTTYLSLAGRYCVLMPNTPQGGGISRKIVDTTDRSRLKAVISSLDISEGMGLIVRTAGMDRNKAEIRRDYEYLVRLWDTIRTRTLSSTAPALIHEEANLIKRSIRDLHAKDIDEILVEGADGYRTAKAFMRALMPSHAKRVQPYEGEVPLFQSFQVERELDSIHEATVRLRSGGYIVINATEALVAIDVNSGRATKARNIEETALKTNLEAAQEVARHLRIRDLAGLIVIDFIDMAHSRNIRAVERCLKDALKSDRARIQVGRISVFGLLEMSRQRLRTSVLEASTTVCPSCAGAGVVRSTESAGLQILRTLEEESARNPNHEITVYLATRLAIYLLNEKRTTLGSLETRYNVKLVLASDDSLVAPEYRLERGALRSLRPSSTGTEAEAEAEAEPEAEEEAAAGAPSEDENDAARPQRKRRRRGKRGGRRRTRGAREADGTASPPQAETGDADVAEPPAGDEAIDSKAPEEKAAPEPRRRRPRRPRGAARVAADPALAAVPDTDAEDQGSVAAAAPRTAGLAADGDTAAGDALPPFAAAAEAPANTAVESAGGDDAAAPRHASDSDRSDAARDSAAPAAAEPRRRGWWKRATSRG